MGLENTHLDVLQNIEATIVCYWKREPRIEDYDVMEAMDAAISFYRAEDRGHTPKEVELQGSRMELYEHLKHVCEWRMGRSGMPSDAKDIPGDERTVEEIVSCLRKVRKSVEKWNSRSGPQGYLQFVSQYVK